MNRTNYLSLITFLLSLIYQHTSLGQAIKEQHNFQPGYIITNQQDSISGFISIVDHRYNTKQCVFKKTIEGEAITYSPGEIKSYGGLQSYFQSYFLSGETNNGVFLDAKLLGDVSLFHFDDRHFILSDGQFEELIQARKEVIRNGNTYFIDQPLFRSTLLSAMGDCQNMNEKLMKIKLNHDDISQAIIDYHVCIDEKFLVMETETKEKIRIRLEVNTGILFYKMNFDGFSLPNYPAEATSSGISFTPSLLFEFSYPNKYKRFKFITGFSYKIFKNKAHDESLVNINNTIDDLRVESSYLELPFLLKYDILNNTPSFYLVGGVGVNFALSWEDELISTTSSGFVLDIFHNELKYKKGMSQSYHLGLGWETSIGKHKNFC